MRRCTFLAIPLAVALAAVFTAPASAAESGGVVHVKSRHGVADTVERARRMIENQGLRVFGIIDHQDAAKKVGETLLPTRVLVFGNPELGTRIMHKNRVAGLDLPMKLLVWEDADGITWITYHRADELAVRHGFAAEDKRFARIGSALKDLAKSAAR